jgi:hypothetical protein
MLDTVGLLYLVNVGSLQPFWSLGYVEGDSVAFSEGFETVSHDSGEMNKNILASLLLDETKTFGVVKPFNLALCHFPSSFFSGHMPEQMWIPLKFPES